MVTAPPRMPVIGDVLQGRFRIESVLGQGGMGIVFGSRRVEDESQVAVKVLAPEASVHPDAIPRFINEARAAMQIASDHVVKVYEVGTLEIGLPFIVMEMLDGSDLLALMERRKSLPIAEAVDYVIQASDAVSLAHEHGIVHRDLKPSNLFLTRSMNGGGGNIVKVLDFGVSKFQNPANMSPALTATGAVLGSPHYMAPEQLKSARDADARADQWSIGVILYELVAGRPPFEGRAYGDLFIQVLSGDFVPLKSTRPNIPDALDQIVGRCLRKSRDERYPNLKELVRALAPFASPDGAARARKLLGEAPPPRDRTAMKNLASTAWMVDRPRSAPMPVTPNLAPAPSQAPLPPPGVFQTGGREPPTLPSRQGSTAGTGGFAAPPSVNYAAPNPGWEPQRSFVPAPAPPMPNTVPGGPSPKIVGLAVGALVVAVVGIALIVVALRARTRTVDPNETRPAVHEPSP